jgi:opacity protein-like surface antigen
LTASCPLFVGLEADIQGALERESNNLSNSFSLFETFTSLPVAEPVAGTAVINYTTKIEWFGTVRLRAGYLWGNGVLSYVTGGLAYGKVDLEGTSTVSGTVAAAACTTKRTFRLLSQWHTYNSVLVSVRWGTLRVIGL